MIHKILISLLFAVLMIGSTKNYAVSGALDGDSLSRAQAYLEQGQYFLALRVIDNVQKNANSRKEQSQVYGLKGNILLRMRHFDEAESFLLQAYDLTEESQQKAGYANSLGVLYNEIGKTQRQEEFFQTALELAKDNPSLAIKIRLNKIRTQSRNIDQSILNAVLSEIANIDSPGERTQYYLNLAEIAKLGDKKNQAIVQQALEKAYATREHIVDKQLQLELLDSLADFYETQNRYQQALELSDQASFLAGQIDADDLLIHIEWRKGRIYEYLGLDDYALAAFGKAVDYVQATRMDIPVEYINGKSSFRETLEPIYLGYAHHLLKKSGKQGGEAKQRTLLLARQTIEQIKQTELEDYLGGRCLIEGIMQNELDSMDSKAAILYPIILPDRLEILVGVGKVIRQYTVDVGGNHIREAATSLSNNLRNPVLLSEEEYLRSAEDLYRWIIAPIEKDLVAEGEIKTLVVVPDGVLRLVPFAALFDGKHFLIEKYAISISPGMSLLGNSKESNKHDGYRMLLAGLSSPGPVIEKLPVSMISAMLQPGSKISSQQNLAGDRGMLSKHLRNITDERKHVINRDSEDLLKQAGAIEKLQRELSLPGVETELNSISNTLKNKILLNEQFTVSNFNQQITGKSYEIIHIASHGIFSSDVNSSFLMAYDDIIMLDDLKKFLKRDTDAGGNIQLLTLSACQTAEGDDRAPLGFTGVALKAEALSALGSLWPISDNAASQLMAGFYRHLTQNLGKAESLRQGQLELLKNPDMRHPFYWAPFILVGNWL